MKEGENMKALNSEMDLMGLILLIGIILTLLNRGLLAKENIIEPADGFQFGIASDVNQTLKDDTTKSDLKSLLVIIRSQDYKYYQEKAEKLKLHLLHQVKEMNQDEGLLDVLMTHEGWAPYGAWTILPIIKILTEQYSSGKKWIFFCEDVTQVNLKRLLNVLGSFSSEKEIFLGHALRDREAAITHHFAFYEDPSVFAYPDFSAGWAISTPMLSWIDERLQKKKPTMDFSIDVQHEVAMYIYNNKKGFNLTDVKELCVNQNIDKANCASNVNRVAPNCGVVSDDDIFVAVKTCEKFHNDRMPFILKTIGKDAKHIKYYSDKADSEIPTEYIGVKNTETGHCTKLHNIIKIAHTDAKYKNKPWVVIIDDDTIISFSRLKRVLACYNPNEPILLGERYGYGVNYESYGYEYITGGGGMILSRRGVEMLVNSGCQCSSDDAPDDMWLGMCFRNMGIPTLHNPSFHQARPTEYAKELLDHQFIVSFHKHYLLDPMDVYKEHLEDDI